MEYTFYKSSNPSEAVIYSEFLTSKGVVGTELHQALRRDVFWA